MKKVAIYCRLSDEDKNKTNRYDDSESIQNQKNMLMKYAIEKEWNIYKIYSDDDWSGLDADRPEFNEMILDAENGKFDIILCKTQSRFTREMELIEKYLHGKFVEWNIRFVGMVDNVDTNIKGNKKSRQINGLVNEWYCEDISESIKAVFDTKRNDGKFIGSFAPYGYKKDTFDKNKLVIDEIAASVIKMIFEWYVNGYGTQHIAHLLNEKNIPNPTRYKQLDGLKFVNSSQKDGHGLWNKTTIKRMLKNEVYIGNMVQGKKKKISYKSKKMVSISEDEWIVVKNTHAPIIDIQTFKIAQDNIKQRIRSTGTGISHLFVTKVRCMDCGSTMVKTKTTHGYEYLRCKLYAREPKKKLCTSHSIRLDYLEDVVANKIRKYIDFLSSDENIIDILLNETDVNKELKKLKSSITKTETQIRDKINIIKNMYTDKIRGVITEDIFKELSQELTKEKEILEKKKLSLEDEMNTLKSRSNNIDTWVKTIQKYKDFEKLNHKMVSKLIKYIEIGQKNKSTNEQEIKVRWLF